MPRRLRKLHHEDLLADPPAFPRHRGQPDEEVLPRPARLLNASGSHLQERGHDPEEEEETAAGSEEGQEAHEEGAQAGGPGVPAAVTELLREGPGRWVPRDLWEELQQDITR